MTAPSRDDESLVLAWMVCGDDACRLTEWLTVPAGTSSVLVVSARCSPPSGPAHSTHSSVTLVLHTKERLVSTSN
jgi:hypothetical protein